MPTLTYATSQIQVFTDAVITNLRARAGLADVFITDGPPPANILGNMPEWVMFADVHGDDVWSAIADPRRPKDETFTIDVVIDVIMNTTPGSDVQPACNRRAIEILAEIEDCLRADPRQGVAPLTGQQVPYVIVSAITAKNLLKRGNDEVREAAIEAGIQVKVRL
jgi:hypothetical protein